MSIPHFSNPFVKRLHHNPMRDWFILLGLFNLALLGIVVWNVLAFETVANGGTIGVPTVPSPVKSLDRSALETARTIFNDRAAEESKYESGAYRFSDPSQP